MFECYTRQSLPDRYYRELLGSALCVFNSNNAFIIENILRVSDSCDWYNLMDKESGKLIASVVDTICKNGNEEIKTEFEKLIAMRNRIIHSFQITDTDGKQRLATKTREKDGNRQFVIDEEYLIEFIRKNEVLSTLLHRFRGY